MMNTLYVFEGIDAKKQEDEAKTRAKLGRTSKVCYHKHGQSCNDKCHEVQANG